MSHDRHDKNGCVEDSEQRKIYSITRTSLDWFRNDLRIAGNPALCAALKQGRARAIRIEATDDRLPRRGAARPIVDLKLSRERALKAFKAS